MDLKPNIELIRFKEYYGMTRGHEHDLLYSLSIEIWSFRLSPNNSGGKGDHYYIQTRHNDLFSLYNRVLKTI